MRQLIIALRVVFFVALIAAFLATPVQTAAIVAAFATLSALLVLRVVERSKMEQKPAVT